MTHFIKYPVGDSCLCWSLGSSIDPELSRIILSSYRILKKTVFQEKGVRDIVPSYTALALHFDPLCMDIGRIVRNIEKVLSEAGMTNHEEEFGTEQSIIHRLNVMYDGPDLERVAELNGLSLRDVAELHKTPCYTVAMIGFVPHFPYLMGLDPRLATPRLEKPRTKVPAGSVAIGGAQTGVYPSVSPGGWNIIGTMDPEPLKNISPGDRILFVEETFP